MRFSVISLCCICCVSATSFAADCSDLVRLQDYRNSAGLYVLNSIGRSPVAFNDIEGADHEALVDVSSRLVAIVNDRSCLMSFGADQMRNVKITHENLRQALHEYDSLEGPKWEATDKSKNEQIEQYLKKYPWGRFSKVANARILENQDAMVQEIIGSGDTAIMIRAFSRVKSFRGGAKILRYIDSSRWVGVNKDEVRDIDAFLKISKVEEYASLAGERKSKLLQDQFEALMAHPDSSSLARYTPRSHDEREKVQIKLDSIAAYRSKLLVARAKLDSLVPDLTVPNFGLTVVGNRYTAFGSKEEQDSAAIFEHLRRIDFWKDSIALNVPTKDELETTPQYQARLMQFSDFSMVQFAGLWSAFCKKNGGRFSRFYHGGIGSEDNVKISLISYDADAGEYLISAKIRDREIADTAKIKCTIEQAKRVKASKLEVASIKYYSSPHANGRILISEIEIDGKKYQTGNEIFSDKYKGELSGFELFRSAFGAELYCEGQYIAGLPDFSDFQSNDERVDLNPTLSAKRLKDGSKVILWSSVYRCNLHMGQCSDPYVSGFAVIISPDGIGVISQMLPPISGPAKIFVKDNGDIQYGDLLIRHSSSRSRISSFSIISPEVRQVVLRGKIYGPFMQDPESGANLHNPYPIFVTETSPPNQKKGNKKKKPKLIWIPVFTEFKLNDGEEYRWVEIQADEYNKGGALEYMNAVVISR